MGVCASCSVVSQSFGGHSGGETPGPIPNPEAKPSSADGTAPDRVWESRTPPNNPFRKGTHSHGSPFVFLHSDRECGMMTPPVTSGRARSPIDRKEPPCRKSRHRKVVRPIRTAGRPRATTGHLAATARGNAGRSDHRPLAPVTVPGARTNVATPATVGAPGIDRRPATVGRVPAGARHPTALEDRVHLPVVAAVKGAQVRAPAVGEALILALLVRSSPICRTTSTRKISNPGSVETC